MNRAQKTAWFTLIVMLVQALVTLQQYGWTGQEASHE